MGMGNAIPSNTNTQDPPQVCMPWWQWWAPVSASWAIILSGRQACMPWWRALLSQILLPWGKCIDNPVLAITGYGENSTPWIQFNYKVSYLYYWGPLKRTITKCYLFSNGRSTETRIDIKAIDQKLRSSLTPSPFTLSKENKNEKIPKPCIDWQWWPVLWRERTNSYSWFQSLAPDQPCLEFFTNLGLLAL